MRTTDEQTRPGTVESPDVETKGREQYAPLWRVIVLNDPVNLMSYVVLVFRKIFGFDESKARRHMLEVHHERRSVLWSGDREKAEAYVHTLHEWQLTAILESDEEN